MKSKDSPYYHFKYARISRRRDKKRAIITIARMILTTIFSMLSTDKVFNPFGLFKIDMPGEPKAKQKEKALRQAIRFIGTQGLSVS